MLIFKGKFSSVLIVYLTIWGKYVYDTNIPLSDIEKIMLQIIIQIKKMVLSYLNHYSNF